MTVLKKGTGMNIPKPHWHVTMVPSMLRIGEHGGEIPLPQVVESLTDKGRRPSRQLELWLRLHSWTSWHRLLATDPPVVQEGMLRRFRAKVTQVA